MSESSPVNKDLKDLKAQLENYSREGYSEGRRVATDSQKFPPKDNSGPVLSMMAETAEPSAKAESSRKEGQTQSGKEFELDAPVTILTHSPKRLKVAPDHLERWAKGLRENNLLILVTPEARLRECVPFLLRDHFIPDDKLMIPATGRELLVDDISVRCMDRGIVTFAGSEALFEALTPKSNPHRLTQLTERLRKKGLYFLVMTSGPELREDLLNESNLGTLVEYADRPEHWLLPLITELFPTRASELFDSVVRQREVGWWSSDERAFHREMRNALRGDFAGIVEGYNEMEGSSDPFQEARKRRGEGPEAILADFGARLEHAVIALATFMPQLPQAQFEACLKSVLGVEAPTEMTKDDPGPGWEDWKRWNKERFIILKNCFVDSNNKIDNFDRSNFRGGDASRVMFLFVDALQRSVVTRPPSKKAAQMAIDAVVFAATENPEGFENCFFETLLAEPGTKEAPTGQLPTAAKWDAWFSPQDIDVAQYRCELAAYFLRELLKRSGTDSIARIALDQLFRWNRHQDIAKLLGRLNPSNEIGGFVLYQSLERLARHGSPEVREHVKSVLLNRCSLPETLIEVSVRLFEMKPPSDQDSSQVWNLACDTWLDIAEALSSRRWKPQELPHPILQATAESDEWADALSAVLGQWLSTPLPAGSHGDPQLADYYLAIMVRRWMIPGPIRKESVPPGSSDEHEMVWEAAVEMAQRLLMHLGQLQTDPLAVTFLFTMLLAEWAESTGNKGFDAMLANVSKVRVGRDRLISISACLSAIDSALIAEAAFIGHRFPAQRGPTKYAHDKRTRLRTLRATLDNAVKMAPPIRV